MLFLALVYLEGSDHYTPAHMLVASLDATFVLMAVCVAVAAHSRADREYNVLRRVGLCLSRLLHQQHSLLSVVVAGAAVFPERYVTHFTGTPACTSERMT